MSIRIVHHHNATVDGAAVLGDGVEREGLPVESRADFRQCCMSLVQVGDVDEDHDAAA
jgi:hypothetical protein